MSWIYLAAIVVLIGSAWFFRGRRPESGMTSYRKHIDALSSESRRGVREVNDRAQNNKRRKP